MKQITLLFSLAALIAIVILGCERDDICAETTATTPQLIIRFYNIDNQNELKTVRQLKIAGLSDDGTVLERIPVPTTNPDSIILPLRFQGEGIQTISRFQLEKDSDYATNDNPDNNSNIDIIEVTYTPEFIYVSRACGYKSIFELLPVSGVSRVNDSDNWISNAQIINQTIENESKAQVIIYH